MRLNKVNLREELSKREAAERLPGTCSYGARLARFEQEVDACAARGIPYWPYMTLHDLSHSLRVIDNIERLLIPIYSLADSRYELNATEVFVLLAAAYLHDVGMFSALCDLDAELIEGRGYEHRGDFSRFSELAAAIRSGDHGYFTSHAAIVGSYFRSAHHCRSADAIRARRSELNISAEADFIARVAEGHRKVDLYGGLFQAARLGMEEVRRDFLAALLRLADELDVLNVRVPNALSVISDRSLDPITRQHWYRHFSVVGCSIEGTMGNTLRIEVHIRQHDSPHAAYINSRVCRMVTDPIQEELAYVARILQVNHVVIEDPVIPRALDFNDQRTRDSDVPADLLREVFNEVEFDYHCPALAAWTDKDDPTVAVLQDGDHLICLFDKDEHLGTKNYCMFDCGFCYRINASRLIDEHGFCFFCPVYSRNPSDGMQEIRRRTDGRWNCPGHVPGEVDTDECSQCNRRATCSQDAEDCLCRLCGLWVDCVSGWQKQIR